MMVRNGSPDGDSVADYLSEIRKVPLLRAEQEVELAMRIEAGLFATAKLAETAGLVWYRRPSLSHRLELQWLAEDGQEARSQLLQANLRLVVSFAKRYTGRGLELLDLIQHGNLGLIRGVEKFDYAKGIKFSTYAVWWIRQAIIRGLGDEGRVVRVPNHVVEQFTRLRKAERELERKLARPATTDELANELGLTRKAVLELKQQGRDAWSLNYELDEEGEFTLGDGVVDGAAVEAFDLAFVGATSEAVREALGELTQRELRVVALYFGLFGFRPRMTTEIGPLLGVSASSAAHSLRRAKTKLKRNPVLEQLFESAA